MTTAMSHADAQRERTVDGGTPASGLGRWSWILYEAAQGPYFVTLAIVVFAPFFAQTIVGDPTRGQALWGYVQGTAGLLVALVSPFLGSIADAAGPRKPGLLAGVLVGAVGMTLLWFAVPGFDSSILLAGALIVLCAVSLEIASVFHNAMLPSIVTPARVGFMSGTGYAMSYVSSIATLVIWLSLFSWPETPALGLSKDAYEVERIIGPLCAIWTILFALPLLFFTPDRPRTGIGFGPAIRQGTATLFETFRELGRYKNIAIFLLARTIYYDGIVVTSTFLGIYAGGIFDWTVAQITAYSAIALILTTIGGVVGGFIDDWIGSKRTIIGAVFLFLAALVLNLGTTPETLFYLPLADDTRATILPVVGPALAQMGYTSLPEQVFMLVGFLSALFGAPALAASRTLMTKLAPPGMSAQFFGLYTLTGKATAFTAPFAIAVLTDASGSQRIGLSVVVLYLIVGGLGMLFVREEQAQRLAHPPGGAAA